MRIGIDTAPILQHQNRGVGALGSHLLHALLRSEGAHRYLLFTPDSARGLSAELSEPQNFEVIHRPPAGGAFSWAWVRDAMRLRRQVKRQRLDVFHAYFQWNLPLRRFPVPVVGHIYDLMPIAVREIYAGRYSLPVDRKIGLYARYLKFALRRIDRAISISEHTRRDLIRLTGFPEERTHVVHPAPAPGMAAPDDVGVIHALRERLGLREDYLLYVGGYDYRKNLEMLLWAFSRARKEGMNLTLALAGDMSSSYGQLIQTLVEEAGDESGVRTLGHIADGDLPALYAGARLFLYPSLYEGFGLPVMDAMACGTPVVSSNAASLPEAGGDAAILLEPGDERAWADAISRAGEKGDSHDDMRRLGIRHAATFSWERAANETIEVYEKLRTRN